MPAQERLPSMLELKGICKRYVTQSFTQVALDSVGLNRIPSLFLLIQVDDHLNESKRLNTEKEQGRFRISPDTTFNKNNRLLTISGKREELKGMESNILWLFCLRINEVIPTVEMCETLWGVYTTDKEKALTRYVCLLNKKLKADKSIAIQNEFARGYKLVNGL